MTEAMKLEWSDFCRHEPKCECKEWLYVTVPDYRTYFDAYNWLRYERKFKFIPVESVMNNDEHSGVYRFKFLCEQEYMWFKLRWQ